MTTLLQIVPSGVLADGASVVIPHGLNINAVGIAPDFVALDAVGFTATATASAVTITNNSGTAGSANVWLERKHSISRQIGAATLSPAPFVASPGEVGGGGAQAVVFDDSTGAQVNIRSARATNQSAIDNTKAGITNLGSSTAATAGATGAYATIGGGDRNVVAGAYGTAPGGYGNIASGDFAFAAGFGATAGGEGAVALGASVASGDYSLAAGNGSDATGAYAVALGNGCTASGSGGQVALGNGCTASGPEGDFAAGNGCQATGGYGSVALGNGSQASGEGAIGIGVGAYATADASLATGENSLASRPSQHAHASYNFPRGSIQTSLLVLDGSTAGGSINQTAILGFGTSTGDVPLELENGKAYAFEVTAIVGADQAGPARVARTIKISFVARRDAGLTTIAASGAGEAFGDASTATWTLTPSVGAAPDRIILTFGTGAGAASAANVAARVEFTEVAF